MSVDIKLKHSSVASRVPTSGDLKNGELALNLADEKVYMKNADGDVVQVAGPNSGDGEYVKVAGDDMTGNLTLGTDKITLDASNGSADFADDIQVAGDANAGEEGCRVRAFGQVSACASGRNVWLGFSKGSAVATSTITDDGSAEFANSIVVGGPVGNTKSYVAIYSYGGSSNYYKTTDAQNAIYEGFSDVGSVKKQVFKVAADGSAEFKGDVAIGDSTTFFGNLGDAIALLPPTITEQFANIISSLPVAQPFTGDPTTLPADIPTPLKDALVRVTTAGKINLNSDGSASFAGTLGINGRATNAGRAIDLSSGSSSGIRINSGDSTDGSYVEFFDSANTPAAGGAANIKFGAVANDFVFKSVKNSDVSSAQVEVARISQIGSASFAGVMYVSGVDADLTADDKNVSYIGSGRLIGNRDDADAIVLETRLKGVQTATVTADGSAEFAGDVKLGSTWSTYVDLFDNNDTSKFGGAVSPQGFLIASRVNDSCLIINQKGDSPSANMVRMLGKGSDVITFAQDGSGVFAGSVQSGPYVANGSGSVFGCYLDPGGTYYSNVSGADDYNWIARRNGTIYSFIKSDGSASFADNRFNITNNGQINQNYQSSGSHAFQIKTNAADPAFTVAADGAGNFAGSVTANGSILTRNVQLHLEPDNADNYTTTTEEYTETETYTVEVPVIQTGVGTADLVDGDGRETRTVTREREVTKTREIKTYTGPTLDVKDTILDLQQRLDTRDAQLEQALVRIQELEVDMNRFKAI